jgi:MYXO-CTERM domain-containing protein
MARLRTAFERLVTGAPGGVRALWPAIADTTPKISESVDDAAGAPITAALAIVGLGSAAIIRRRRRTQSEAGNGPRFNHLEE